MYLQAARLAPGTRYGTHVTGDVLHLAVFNQSQDQRTPSRWGPLCRTPLETVRLTWPGVPGWQRHAHWPVCSRCRAALEEIAASLAEQDTRHNDHMSRSLPDATPTDDPMEQT